MASSQKNRLKASVPVKKSGGSPLKSVASAPAKARSKTISPSGGKSSVSKMAPAKKHAKAVLVA